MANKPSLQICFEQHLGYCAFPNFDDAARAFYFAYEVSVTSTETGEAIDGYCFDEDQDVLWFEGTAQVAVMHWVAGDREKAEAVLDELKKDGSRPCW